MYFQDLILTLQKHWAEQGCIVAQPYDLEVGAGTMAPTTFLRALGLGNSPVRNSCLCTSVARTERTSE